MNSTYHCALCGKEINPAKDKPMRRVFGWADGKSGGRSLTVYAPTDIPQYAHKQCVTNLNLGVIKDQIPLF